MSIFLPFNFQPTSVSVKLSSYTIPAGSYAYVVAEVEDGGSFSLDGVAALNSEAETTSALVSVDVSRSGDGTIYTVPANHIFEGQYVTSTGADMDLEVDASIVIARDINTATPVSFKLGPSQVLEVDNYSTGTVYVTGYARRIFEPETALVGHFWVPTGTVINGTGAWRATVSLFNEIT